MDAPTDEQAPESAQSDSTRSTTELFRYSTWLHVGVGAQECAEREGGCTNREHFHAWVRLPNQFQHQDIRERALAAKARRARQLRDPNTDAYEVLEDELAELARSDDREPIVTELIGKEWWKRSLSAMSEVDEREEYKTVQRDRERLAELRLLSEDERPKDEFEELERHLIGYGEAVQEETEKLERPLRDAFEAMDTGELIDLVREDRITAEASTSFMENYSKWEWFAGTYTSAGINRQRSFASMEQLDEAAPEVIDALREAFNELEGSLQRGAAGN
jgi:hypothetical protein